MYIKESISAFTLLVAQVPEGDYELPLGRAEMVKEGTDCTLIGWGSQVRVLLEAAEMAQERDGVSCEVIDLQSILPWDKKAVLDSVHKTGRLLVAHEAPKTGGFAAEIAATVQEEAILKLKSPISRVTGWDTPFPLVFERLYLPDKLRCYEAIQKTINF
jgi:2-oxoisovalerate dehydrogenase E1 component beta subunit